MYRLTDNADLIVRAADNTVIPRGHRWWYEYEAWLAAGGVPLAYVPPAPVVPQTVTRFQARAALYNAGLLPQVEALMADPATGELARMAWADAQEFRRTSPTVLAMAAALGLSDVQLDALFVAAAGIEA